MEVRRIDKDPSTFYQSYEFCIMNKDLQFLILHYIPQTNLIIYMQFHERDLT